MTEEEQFAHFETMGEGHVRDMTHQWQGPVQALAYKWLAQKDQESRLRSDASQASQMRTALSTRNAAWIAAIAAISAAVIAIATIIVTYLSWVFPVH